MAKGKTLWEMLTEKLHGPVESQYYNPLLARIGSSVMIDDLDFRDYNFFVKEVREYRRTIESKQYVFTDYVLLAHPPKGDDVWARLRLNPRPEADAGGLTHDVLLLQLYDEMAYDKGLHDVVTDATKKFEVSENGHLVAEYRRINEVSSSYQATVAIVKDANKDHTVDQDKVDKVHLEYWDYWRQTPDEAGQPFTEFLFVEMNTDNGWFQIWRGREIDPQRVCLI